MWSLETERRRGREPERLGGERLRSEPLPGPLLALVTRVARAHRKPLAVGRELHARVAYHVSHLIALREHTSFAVYEKIYLHLLLICTSSVMLISGLVNVAYK